MFGKVLKDDLCVLKAPLAMGIIQMFIWVLVRPYLL